MPATALPRSDDLAAVQVFVPGPLRPYCGGASRLSLSARDVRGTLERLELEYPSLYRNVCDETGAVRRHINVFVNTSHMRDRDGLDTELAPGDTIIILPAVSGG
jgi:molybdopterin converting factor small subunit